MVDGIVLLVDQMTIYILVLMNDIVHHILSLLDLGRLGIVKEEGGYNLSVIMCYQQTCRLASGFQYDSR